MWVQKNEGAIALRPLLIRQGYHDAHAITALWYSKCLLNNWLRYIYHNAVSITVTGSSKQARDGSVSLVGCQASFGQRPLQETSNTVR